MLGLKFIRKWTWGFPSAFTNANQRYGTWIDPRMNDKLYKAIELEIRSCEPAVMRSYQHFIKSAASLLDITVDKVVTAKRHNLQRFTVLKSAFVHRKHLVQYEIRTHYTWIHLSKLTGSTADTFLEYIERMLPEGVALKVTKVSVEPFPEHLNADNLKSITQRPTQPSVTQG